MDRNENVDNELDDPLQIFRILSNFSGSHRFAIIKGRFRIG